MRHSWEKKHYIKTTEENSCYGDSNTFIVVGFHYRGIPLFYQRYLCHINLHKVSRRRHAPLRKLTVKRSPTVSKVCPPSARARCDISKYVNRSATHARVFFAFSMQDLKQFTRHNHCGFVCVCGYIWLHASGKDNLHFWRHNKRWRKWNVTTVKLEGKRGRRSLIESMLNS